MDAVVTGGSSGIGFGIAGFLLRKGYRVTIAERGEVDLAAALDQLSQLDPVEGVAADVTDEADVERVLSAFDHPDRPLACWSTTPVLPITRS